MPLLSKRAQEEGKKSSSSGVDRYLNPGKLEDGSSVRFSLLEENALDFYEVWGSLTEDSSKSRPYRFTDDPTPEDIEVYLHSNAPVTDTSARAYDDILAAATRAEELKSILRIT